MTSPAIASDSIGQSHPTPPAPGATISALRLGDVAPNFTARTTMGETSLADYRGRWLLFFSHPADFTPVCTSEFVALAKMAPQFAALDCALLGLSVDSLYAHIAWVRAIEQQFGFAIPFPIVEDPSMAVGRAYGMIDAQAQDSAAIRCCYFIDPAGVIRAITSYPHNVGRSVDEMLRMVAALTTASAQSAFTPEGWRPGEALLSAPPDHAAAAPDGPDWFCRSEAETKTKSDTAP